MVFVAPKMTAEQALVVAASVWVISKRNRFRRLLQEQNCLWLLDAAPPVNRSQSFEVVLDDATAKVRYRFTIAQLRTLASKLRLPAQGVTTPSGDRVNRVEALAMLCHRLYEA